MNKDLVIGILVSLFIHGGFFGYEYLMPKGKANKIVQKIEEERTIQFEIPPEEPEKPDKIESLDEPEETVVAPPSLTDTLTVVPLDAFTTPITPPPPPGLTIDNTAISIPVVTPGANFGKNIPDLFNAADLDTPVQLRVSVAPKYPVDMRRQDISGEVLVEFIIDTNGNVSAAQIIRSSHREFEQPSLDAVRKWKFRPNKKNGKIVNCRAQQLVQFSPKDD